MRTASAKLCSASMQPSRNQHKVSAIPHPRVIGCICTTWSPWTSVLRCVLWIAGRLESFFGAVTTKKSDTGKRKEPEKGKGKAGAPAKKGKSGIGKK